MKHVIKTFIYLCVAFLIICTVISFIQKIINPNKIPNFLGYKSFIILSGSMEDTLSVGDIIFIKETKKMKNGDIITYRENQALITHRIIDIIIENGETYYQTKGDANSTADSNYVSIDKVEGKYCFKIPMLGNIIMFIRNQIGIVPLLILCISIYVCKEINKYKKYKKEN